MTDSGKDLLYFDNNYPCTDRVSLDLVKRRLKVDIPFDSRYMSSVAGHVFLDCFVDVPCGKCDDCRLSNARKWAQRCLMEMMTTSGPCWFLTLTFDDAHCPQKVQKADFSMFMKRLRNRLAKPGIRFFACGEYGEKTGRPHYHAILFDCPLDDLYLVDASQNLRGSKTIDEIWPYGMHVLADVTKESVNYVARYTSKKTGAKKGFILSSRRPGIGHDFLLNKRDLLRLGYCPVSDEGRLMRAPLPRYAERIFPDFDWISLKDKRLRAAFARRNLESFAYGLSSVRLDDYKRALMASKARRLEKVEI